MEGGIGWIILLIVLAWAGYAVYQGYRKETAPPLPTVTTGDGLKVPICPHCSTRLITMERHAHGAIASVFGGLVFALGLIFMLLAHLVGGLVILAVGVLIILAGKYRHTVITCPACGKDARSLT